MHDAGLRLMAAAAGRRRHRNVGQVVRAGRQRRKFFVLDFLVSFAIVLHFVLDFLGSSVPFLFWISSVLLPRFRFLSGQVLYCPES